MAPGLRTGLLQPEVGATKKQPPPTLANPSEMQLRDVRTLIDESVDWPYLKDWAAKLGVAAKLDEASK